jgi:hypothetical protein
LSLFKKIQEKIIPVSKNESAVIMTPPPNINREFINLRAHTGLEFYLIIQILPHKK